MYSSELSSEFAEHIKQIECIIQNDFPEIFGMEEKSLIKWTQEFLPLIRWSEFLVPQNFFSFYLICEHFNDLNPAFFLERLIKQKLLFRKNFEVVSCKNMNFYLPFNAEQIFFVSEIKIYLNIEQKEFARLNLSGFAKEAALKIKSQKKVLDFFDASHFGSKSYSIHEILTSLLKKHTKSLDKLAFKEMNQILVLTNDAFKEHRSSRHLSRIIFSLYLIRKNIRNALTSLGRKRHIQIRFIPTRLQFTFGNKSVLGIAVGISLFDRHEIFEEKHLLWAIQKFLPSVQSIRDSFYLYQQPNDEIRILYLEIEKKEGIKFSSKEIFLLKQFLSHEIQLRVEELVPALFMNRNEEEIIKSILILSKELTSLYDLPQMMIHLEAQNKTDLTFIIVLVRILKDDYKTIASYFSHIDQSIFYSFERTRIVGYLKDKPKEASVLRVQIPYHADFLRSDFSINFYLARQKAINFITENLGEVRDYNGGMILKQTEILSDLKQTFLEIESKFIEDFFYSLSPIENQATIPLDILIHLFEMFLEVSKEKFLKKENYILKNEENYRYGFIVIKAENPTIKSHLRKILKSDISVINDAFVHSQFEYQGALFVGCAYNYSHDLQKHLQVIIHRALKSGIDEIDNRQTLKLAIRNDPISIDPRIGGEEQSSIVLKMLFEGLIRIEQDGSLGFAIAESVEISQDNKHYQFKLRNTFWSNGDSLIAYDFEYAWKKILSHYFKTQFASLFYSIKNAKKAKQGLISLDLVGIKALDQNTLIIELEHPAPYFLELLCLPLFSPINHQVDQKFPNWSFQEVGAFVCNGPFQLSKQNLLYGYELEKNPYYWDAKEVNLQQIHLIKADVKLAYEMFQNGELEFVGKNMPVWEPLFIKKCDEKIESQITPKISWYVFNTRLPFFNNIKIRRALCHAIDKTHIAELLNLDEIAAFTPLPFSISQCKDQKELSYDLRKAQALLKEGLDELKLKIHQIPILKIAFPKVDMKEKIAEFLCQSWEKILGIKCLLEAYDWPTLFSKISEGDFCVSIIVWNSWINDPIYTLNAFRDKDDKINFSKWENVKYQELLDAADAENNPIIRLKYLKQAEDILIQEAPVCPLFFERFHYLKKEYLNLNDNFKNGYPDFKKATINKKSINF